MFPALYLTLKSGRKVAGKYVGHRDGYVLYMFGKALYEFSIKSIEDLFLGNLHAVLIPKRIPKGKECIAMNRCKNKGLEVF